jgi:hypothetical protein
VYVTVNSTNTLSDWVQARPFVLIPKNPFAAVTVTEPAPDHASSDVGNQSQKPCPALISGSVIVVPDVPA